MQCIVRSTSCISHQLATSCQLQAPEPSPHRRTMLRTHGSIEVRTATTMPTSVRRRHSALWLVLAQPCPPLRLAPLPRVTQDRRRMRPALLALRALPVRGFLAPLVHCVHLHVHRGTVRSRNPASILLPLHLHRMHGLHGRATPSMLHRLGAPHVDSVDSALSLVHRKQAYTHACAYSPVHNRPNTFTLVWVLSGELRIGRVHTCNAYGSVCSKTHWFHAHHCEAPPDGWCNAEGYQLLDGTHQRCDFHLFMSMHMQMSASTTPQHPNRETCSVAGNWTHKRALSRTRRCRRPRHLLVLHVAHGGARRPIQPSAPSVARPRCNASPVPADLSSTSRSKRFVIPSSKNGLAHDAP